MFKCICDLKYDWLRLNGVNVLYVPDDYWQARDKIFFLFKRTIPLPVEIIRPMLSLPNYGLKHLILPD